MTGLLIKAIAGFYYVEAEGRVYQCKARGVFKNRNITPLVGDVVEIEEREEGEGIITSVRKRKNEFVRPPIANVDLLVVTIALAHPTPSFGLIDRFLTAAEKAGPDIIMCFNKVDADKKGMRERMREIYGGIYETYFVSGKTGEGVAGLAERLAGKKVALAGPSGVGKSTLLNRLHSRAEAETGEISKKTGRGRHTTRHVEIFPLDLGGKIFDTPGFTSFDVPEIEEAELASYFPEMEKYSGQCRFDDCRHLKEPGCRVIKALEEGDISPERYQSYAAMMEEIRKKNQY